MGRDRPPLSGRGRAATALAGRALIVAVPVAFLGLMFWYPLAVIGAEAFDGNTVVDVWTDRITWDVVWFTTWQAGASTALTLLIAFPTAAALAKFEFRGRRAVTAAVTVPFVLPSVVVATAFLALFDRFSLDGGAIDLRQSVWAVLIAHVFFEFAIVVRTVGGYWAQLDERPAEAARTLGAGPVRTFAQVTLPRLMPAVASAAALVFLFTFTSFGIILILGGPRRATLDTEIWRFATQRLEFDVAAALTVVQLVTVLGVVVLNAHLSRRTGNAGGLRAERRRPVRSRRQRVSLAVGLGTAAVVLGVPLAVLAERSVRTRDGFSLSYWRSLGGTGDTRIRALFVAPVDAIVNSLTFAAVATLIALVVGTAASLVIVHGRHLVSRVLEVAVLVPLGTSAVAVGFGILVGLDTPPVDLRSRWILVPLAHAVIGTPFVVRSVVPVLRGIDRHVREAAVVLGAAPGAVRREIDLPMAARALTAGAAFTFAISLGEFGATSFVVRADRPTVPVAIFDLLGRPGDAAFGQAMALSVILVAMTGAAVWLIDRLGPGELRAI